MIKYPSINQFRNIIREVTNATRFKGMDENDEPMFYKDYEMELPTLKFRGTVKIHGTNASVSYNSNDGMWVQSRKNIITSTQDNAGFAFFIESIGVDNFRSIFADYFDFVDTTTNTVVIYGEWAGMKIQKGVAVAELDKMFYVFGVKVRPHNGDTSYWLKLKGIDFGHDKIHNIDKFGSFDIDIDFNNPKLAQNDIIKMTLAVEDECPVGKFFGVSGIGEGIVFSHLKDDGSQYIFKSKGQKHSISKTKTLAPIDVEKLANIAEFIEYAVTPNRLTQGLVEVFTNEGITPDMKDTGKLLKWINSDICKEEMDVLVENGLEFRDVVKASSKATVDWFKEYLNARDGL